MPNVTVHCAISRKRTGDMYKELHEWMDEATEYLGHNHRLERHFFTQEYKDYIERKWGKKAVVEWLFHIALDNLETANKYAVNAYHKSFDEITVKFKGKEIAKCNFIKQHLNSRKRFEVDVEQMGNLDE